MFQLNPAPLDSENNNLSESKLYKKSNNKTVKNKKTVEFDESNITNTKNNEVLKNKITSLGNLMSKIHENNGEEDDNLNTNYQSNTIDESISTSFTDNLNEQLAKIQKMREAGNNIPQNNFFNNELQNSNTSNIDTMKNNTATLENSDVLSGSKNDLSSYSDSYKLNYNSLSQNIDTNNYDNNKLLSKLDYIVHLLEEQHNEKTNYITEELILYLFLGIFILFVLDSFARASKYVR